MDDLAGVGDVGAGGAARRKKASAAPKGAQAEPGKREEDDDEMSDVLADLPSCADREACELVAEATGDVDKLVDEHKRRVEAMAEQLKNVQQELLDTQRRLRATQEEIETERRLKQLAERTARRIRQELHQLGVLGGDEGAAAGAEGNKSALPPNSAYTHSML